MTGLASGRSIIKPEPIPLPIDRTASPAARRAAYIIAGGLALLPVLYVGSFALIVLDDQMKWGFWGLLDERVQSALRVIYWPLTRVYFKVLGIE